MARSLPIARLRKTLRRHAQQGWQRAVFARPQSQQQGEADGDLDEEIVQGPGGRPNDAALDDLVGRAEAAARAGRVKQTLVVDERTRVKIDARHGKAKVQQLDPATVSKMMGGKDRPLRPDDSADLLRVIGIMNPDGSISARHAKKYKQVNHFVTLCRPTIERLTNARTVDDGHPLRVADLGCGNAYLTFVLAEALRLASVPARIHGVDVRTDVIERSRSRAAGLGWSHLTFEVGPIEGFDPSAALDGPPDLVLALHACDTATDDALRIAIEHHAGAVFAAPCCQRELATQLDSAGTSAPLPALIDQSLLRRDYAALLTDALRIEFLQAAGYDVDLLEFVASEHTPKNLLIRGHRRPGTKTIDPERLAEIAQRTESLGIAPKLLRYLARAGD